MLKKIAAAAVLAGALAFSAAAPAVFAAGSLAENENLAVATGNWPDPVSSKVKKDKKSTTTTDTSYVTYTGNWPDPV